MQPRTVRFSDKTAKSIEASSQQRGFASSSAFIRYAVEQELTGREDDLIGAEERRAGIIEAVRRDLFRVMRVQQALFAYLDTLAKTFLTSVQNRQPTSRPRQSRGRRNVTIVYSRVRAERWSESRS
jgi:Arc/MetJ-type ribon-helix-helix transcriptional regulator